ncbi:hypothetical protein [Streptomyces canus]|uniref:hypothetical protein n=1 Tax=Streptomyces canus TaxID=58343 RepID=UPI003243DEC4
MGRERSGDVVRELDHAWGSAAARGFGHYEGFACPEKSPDGPSWVFFLPLAAGFGFFAFRLLHGLDEGYRWLRFSGAVLCLMMAAGGVVIVFLPLYLRRPGGPAPRLYCFEDGVVVATRRTLRPLGWHEVSVDSVEWWGHEDQGTRITVKGPDGSVLALFPRKEIYANGAWRIESLHKAAVAGGAADGGPDHHDHSPD